MRAAPSSFGASVAASSQKLASALRYGTPASCCSKYSWMSQTSSSPRPGWGELAAARARARTASMRSAVGSVSALRSPSRKKVLPMILMMSAAESRRRHTGWPAGCGWARIEKRVTSPVDSFSPTGLISRMKSFGWPSNSAVSGWSEGAASTETRYDLPAWLGPKTPTHIGRRTAVSSLRAVVVKRRNSRVSTGRSAPSVAWFCSVSSQSIAARPASAVCLQVATRLVGSAMASSSLSAPRGCRCRASRRRRSPASAGAARRRS